MEMLNHGVLQTKHKKKNPQFCNIAYGLLECDTDLSSGCDLIFVI